LRRRHFPKERSFIPAHLTLFHHLPGQEVDAVLGTVRGLAAGEVPMRLEVVGLRFMGRGGAYRIESSALVAWRGRLAEAFAPWLGSQDRRPFRPHVTVQNKVPAEVARALYAELATGFAPFLAEGTAALLWRYRGGAWEAVAALPFRGAA
jgi:hypothetical protein